MSIHNAVTIALILWVPFILIVLLCFAVLAVLARKQREAADRHMEEFNRRQDERLRKFWSDQT